MARFLLLLRGGNSELKNYSPEELQRLFEEYRHWVEQLNRSGRLIVTQKIEPENGRLLTQENGQTKVDELIGGNGDTITGYFLLRATDYDDVVTQTRNCPILTHGGCLEIWELAEGPCRD